MINVIIMLLFDGKLAIKYCFMTNEFNHMVSRLLLIDLLRNARISSRKSWLGNQLVN